MGQKTTKLTNLHGLGHIHDPIIDIPPLTSLRNRPTPEYNSTLEERPSSVCLHQTHTVN